MVMGLLSPRGSQITTTTVAGIGYATIMTRERCLLALSSSSASSLVRGLFPGRQPGLAGWMSFEFLFVFHP